jgi:hypothetical protein
MLNSTWRKGVGVGAGILILSSLGASPSQALSSVGMSALQSRIAGLKAEFYSKQERLEGLARLRPVPSVHLLAPNGGETLVAGQVYTIGWFTGGLAEKTFTLYYNKSDNARVPIVSGVRGYSYDWTVPAGLEGVFALAVEVDGMSSLVDWSDGTFAVRAPRPAAERKVVPSLTSLNTSSGPAGTLVVVRGTGFSPYATNTIHFRAAGGGGGIVFSVFSTDGATLSFAVPNLAPGAYEVWVENNDLRESNKIPFTLTGGERIASTPTPSVPPTVPKPASAVPAGPALTFTLNGIAGDQSVARGTPVTFVWNAAGAAGCFTNFAAAGTGTSGRHVFEMNQSGNYAVSCYDAQGRSSARSIRVTVVEPPLYTPPTLALLSPNGGEKFEKGKTYPITWKSSGVNAVQIWLINAGTAAEYRLDTYGVPAEPGSYSWTVPESLPEVNYVVKVMSSESTKVGDQSDAPFAVVAAAPVAPVTAAHITVAVRVNGAAEATVPSGEKVKFSWVASAPAARCEGSGLLAGKNIGTGTSGQYELAVTEGGEYAVTCYDPQNRKNSGAVAIRVAATTGANQPPVIKDWSGPTSIQSGTPGKYRVMVADPDGLSVTVRVGWGDGGEETRTVQLSEATASAEAEFTHAYSIGNYTYTARVTVTDAAGASAYRDLAVTVTPRTTAAAFLAPSQNRSGFQNQRELGNVLETMRAVLEALGQTVR